MERIREIHLKTVRHETHLLIRQLNARLGTTMVAYLANATTKRQPDRWASDPDDSSYEKPSAEVRKRLQLAATAFTAIEDCEGVLAARAWFIEPNQGLSGQAPAQRIREFDAPAVFMAAHTFVEGAN